jgi:hypothetical protein
MNEVERVLMSVAPPAGRMGRHEVFLEMPPGFMMSSYLLSSDLVPEKNPSTSLLQSFLEQGFPVVA